MDVVNLNGIDPYLAFLFSESLQEVVWVGQEDRHARPKLSVVPGLWPEEVGSSHSTSVNLKSKTKYNVEIALGVYSTTQ